jgi:hypothetical protein
MALLLVHFIDSGVPPVDGVMLDTGDLAQMNARV